MYSRYKNSISKKTRNISFLSPSEKKAVVLPAPDEIFLGRQNELQTLSDIYRDLKHNGGIRIAAIEGVSGAGKSTLVKKFISDFPDVIYGKADINDPQALFSQLTDKSKTLSSQKNVLNFLNAKSHEITSALSLVISSLLEAKKDTSPLIIVFEDLHYMRGIIKDVVDSLPFALKNSLNAKSGLMLIFTYRQKSDIDISTSGVNYTSIKLLPLGIQELNEAGISTGNAESIKPIVIGEWLRLIKQIGTTSLEDSPKLPDKIESVVKMRLNLLDEQQKNILIHAAVMGLSFSSELLSTVIFRVTGKKINSNELDKLQTDGFLYKKGSNYEFVHELVQKTIYSFAFNKRIIHSIAAETMETLDAKKYCREIAGHYELADLKPKAVEWIKQAMYKASNEYDYRGAADMAEELISKYADNITKEEKFEAEMLGGRMLEKMAEFNSAKVKLEEAYKTATALRSPLKKVIAHEKLGSVLIHLGQYDKALKLLNNALKFSFKPENKKTEADILINLCRIYHDKADYIKEYNILRKHKEISDSLGDPEQEMINIQFFSIYYYERGDLDKSIEYNKKYISRAEKMGDPTLLSKGLTNLGADYIYRGDFTAATEMFERAIFLDKKTGNRRQMMDPLINLGAVNCFIGNYDKAAEYYTELLKLAESTGELTGLIIAYDGLGAVSYATAKFEDALEYVRKQEELCKKHKKVSELCNAISTKASILMSKGKYDEALENMKKVLEISNKSDNKTVAAQQYVNISNLYWYWKDYSKGELYGRLAVQAAKKHKLYAILPLALGNYTENLIKKGNYKKALEISKEIEPAASKISDENFLFKGQFFSALSNLYLNAENLSDEALQKTFSSLSELAGKPDNDRDKAIMYLETAIAGREYKKSIDIKNSFLECAGKAYELYDQLYNKYNYHQYMIKREEAKNLISKIN